MLSVAHVLFLLWHVLMSPVKNIHYGPNSFLHLTQFNAKMSISVYCTVSLKKIWNEVNIQYIHWCVCYIYTLRLLLGIEYSTECSEEPGVRYNPESDMFSALGLTSSEAQLYTAILNVASLNLYSSHTYSVHTHSPACKHINTLWLICLCSVYFFLVFLQSVGKTSSTKSVRGKWCWCNYWSKYEVVALCEH